MAQNAEQVRVAPRGDLWVAPVGSTLPTDLEDLSSPWVNLGLTTEEGTALTYSEAREDIPAWQRATPVRRLVTARNMSTGYTLLQWNADNFALAFGGGEISEPSPGVYRYDPPDDDDPLSEYAQVIDFHDGDIHGRLVIEKGAVNDDVQTNLVRTAASTLPVTFQALASDDSDESTWYLLSNDPAFEPVS